MAVNDPSEVLERLEAEVAAAGPASEHELGQRYFALIAKLSEDELSLLLHDDPEHTAHAVAVEVWRSRTGQEGGVEYPVKPRSLATSYVVSPVEDWWSRDRN